MQLTENAYRVLHKKRRTIAAHGAQYSPHAPSELGSGIVTGILGEGGMAVVYEIWNEKLGLKRAVKLLRPNYTTENRNRFDTEIKLCAQLDHPNIIRIHSVGQWQGLPYIEMEKVEGLSLGQLVARRGALPTEVAVAVGLVISRALNYTHTRVYTIEGKQISGLLHRDMKPENILISKNGKVRLTDFGIATPINVSMHTPDGSIVGSLQYIAPEQLEEKDIDCRADIFSFGCVMYEMLTGFKAFPEKKLSELVPKRLENSFDPFDRYDLHIPQRLRTLVKRCLQKDIGKRPATMEVVSKLLGNILNSLTNKSAEELIREFMAAPQRDVAFVTYRPARPWYLLPLTATVFITVLVVGMLVNGYFGKTLQEKEEKSTNQAKIAVQWSLFDDVAQSGFSEPESSNPLLRQPLSILSAQSLIDSLKILHQTDNLLNVMIAEEKNGNYETCLRLGEVLPQHLKKTKTAVIILMRAHDKSESLTVSFFKKWHINDAEFYFTKALCLAKTERYTLALESLDKLPAFSAVMSDNEKIYNAALLLRARILTKKYNDYPGSVREDELAAVWRAVKERYKDSNDLAVLNEAVENCQKFSEMYL